MLAMLAADPDPTSGADPTDPVPPGDTAPDPSPSRVASAAAAVGGVGTTSITAPPAGARQPDLLTTTTVLLVRHGRTRLTQERRFSGVRGEDAPLTDVGRLDAVGAAQFLRETTVDAVVVSPLLRARQTAGLLGDRLGWPEPVVDQRWAEVAFGEWDGLTAAEVSQRDPELFTQWLSRADVRPPGGESMLDLEARVKAGLDDVLREHAGGTVVVVCHMTPVRSVVRTVLDAGETALWRLRCAPGSLTTVRFWPDGGAEVDGVGLHVPPDAPEVLF
jgi:broad specificity phosphatase PhoE